MSKYQGAAKRRATKNRSMETQGMELGQGDLGQIQKLIEREQNAPTPQGPEGEEIGEGGLFQMFPELGEAMGKAQAGINEPGPPQEMIRRMKRQRALQSIKPDVADLAARYGVLPGANF